ncbi:MAG: hypothetical protein DCF32_03145 [Leptolyngbya sp.]|nr:MAG: hypothetical protein DCF32_03145 [Leptolyngbya sp.]
MTPLFKKLNLKAQAEILGLNAPASFEPELAALEGVTIQRSPADLQSITFALVFVTQQADWSALRFRRVEFIKSMTRDANVAINKPGKGRLSKPAG